jgi:hypothetical protein
MTLIEPLFALSPPGCRAALPLNLRLTVVGPAINLAPIQNRV